MPMGSAGVIAKPAAAAGGFNTGTFIGSAATAGAAPTSLSRAQADFDVAPSSGDIIICFVHTNRDAKTGVDMGLPTGFTSIAFNNLGNNILRFGYKVAGGAEGTYTTTGTASCFYGHLHFVVIRTTVTYDGYGTGGTVGNNDPVAISVGLPETIPGMLVAFYEVDLFGNNLNVPASMTQARATVSGSNAKSAYEQLTGAMSARTFLESGTWTLGPGQVGAMVNVR
jgi:hypothetical protein